LYDDARRELIAGKYDSARNTFTRLAGEAKGKQPLLNWIRLHRGLANLLRGYTTQARQAFQELENDANFSTRPEDKSFVAFFRMTAHTMNSAEPVRPESVIDPAPPPDTLALFLFGIKDWQQSDFPNAAVLLERYKRSESSGTLAWINDYKPLAEKFLSDYRIFADWQKQSQTFTKPEQITAALTALKAAQSKLQLRGRLNEAFKDEEAKLTKRLEPRK
jgi:hypothetical protein